METKDLIKKYGVGLEMLGYAVSKKGVEEMREANSGYFGNTVYRNGEQHTETEYDHNIVTNEGLVSLLDTALGDAANIDTWYLTMNSTTGTAEAATMTYAVPVFTEITTTDVTDANRITWTPGAPDVSTPTTPTLANSSAVTYTCNTTGFTAYGAALLGGGTSAFGHTASGTLYSYSLFASSKVLASTDTIAVTYTFTATDS